MDDRADAFDTAFDTAAPPAEEVPPEVAEVIAGPPRWAARGLLYVVAGSTLAALLWAQLSVIDVTVEARGALVPEGYVRPVQAAGGGRVQYVLVGEGDEVGRGQALIQLDAAELRGRLAKLQGELDRARAQLRQLRAQGPVASVLEQENRIARTEAEKAEAESALSQTTITAPAAGVITALDVRGPGVVLEPGQRVATIAPAGTKLVAEALILDKDIAFIEAGLPAALKLEAFPYQDYGALGGIVAYVSYDAQEGPKEQGEGAAYKVLIVPDRAAVRARGRDIPLRAGLTLRAEIVTERRSVLSLLLEPFGQLRGGL